MKPCSPRRHFRLLAGLLVGGLAIGGPGPSAAPALAGSPAIDWSLRGIDGKPVAMTDLPPKFLLAYFGYTYCPDLCPTALVDLSVILHELGPLAERVQLVFVSIDPERDSDAVLAQYVTNFDASILPLTGTAEQIAAAARQVDFHFVRYQDPGLADYSFDHSSSFFVIDPARRLIADFPTELTPAEIVPQLRALIARPFPAVPAKPHPEGD